MHKLHFSSKYHVFQSVISSSLWGLFLKLNQQTSLHLFTSSHQFLCCMLVRHARFFARMMGYKSGRNLSWEVRFGVIKAYIDSRGQKRPHLKAGANRTIRIRTVRTSDKRTPRIRKLVSCQNYSKL